MGVEKVLRMGLAASVGLCLIAAAAGLFIGRIPNRFFKGRLLKPLALGIAASLSSVSVIALPHAALAALSWEIILAVSAQITIRRRASDSTAGERRWKF